MNLTPEQRTVGRQNYVNAAMSRRDFLKNSALAGVVAGGSLGAFYFGYGATVADPLRVGVIGTGDEGSVLIGAINPDFIRVKAFADIRPYNVHRAFHGDYYSDAALAARPGLLAKYGWKTEAEGRKNVSVYGAYQELLENAKKDNLEAVIIALPLHLHHPAALAAMNAGLHVLTEKLMGHSVGQCKEMAQVAKETHRYLVTGHQRHYNILYDNAVEQIKRKIKGANGKDESALLGELHYIRAQWHRGNLPYPDNDSWQQPMPRKIKPDDDRAKQLDSDLRSWESQLRQATSSKDIELLAKRVAQKKAQIADEVLAGTAEKYGYEPLQYKKPDGTVVYDRPPAEELIRWRLFDRTGAGLMAELGSHQLDAAGIFIAAAHPTGEKQIPLSVVAAANRPLFPVDRDVEDHVYCVIEYPAPGYNADDPYDSQKKIGVQYASINGNGFGGYGEIVFGTKGTLIIDREQEAMLFQGSDTSSTIAVSQADGPTLDTQESAAQQAAVAQAATQQVSRGYTEEEEHWAWCIRQDPDNQDPAVMPKCHPKVALADAVIALTTNIAARHNMRIDFKKEWFDPDNPATPEDDVKV